MGRLDLVALLAGCLPTNMAEPRRPRLKGSHSVEGTGRSSAAMTFPFWLKLK